MEAKFDSWNCGIFVTINVENYLHLGHGITDGNTGLELETCVLPPTGPRIINNGPDTSNPNSETCFEDLAHATKTEDDEGNH